jgi:hypothetical protein
MTLHITKKLADKLNLNPVAESVTDEFLSWRANYVQGHGKRFVVFMNDASRFTVILNEAKAAKLKKLPELFITALRDAFLAIGVNSEVIDRYIADLGSVTYAKNSDRKKTAQLNKSADLTWWALRDYTSDVELSLCVSNIECGTFSSDEAFTPRIKMLELLGRYGLPVRKFRALDITVRLDLDGNDAVRKLRVPALITFEQLHLVLQAAFSWKNRHMYSFVLFKKWSDNYYARPDIELVASEEDFEANPGAKLMEGLSLADYVPEYRRILYTYDYGDDWRHYIEVDNIIDDCDEDLPVLLSGEGDAPPEDVGGAGGFAEFLKIIANPEHEEYESLTEWSKSQWWKPFDFELTARFVKNRL